MKKFRVAPQLALPALGLLMFASVSLGQSPAGQTGTVAKTTTAAEVFGSICKCTRY